MDGVLVVDKPQHLTSHDVVARVRRLLGTRRIGHIGTLDPMATGVLPLVVGRATRLASLLSGGPKIYEAVIRIGVTTDTYDVTGSVVSQAGGASEPPQALDLATVEATSRAFTGTFLQRPPPFSAKKIRGVRAYQLARRRETVQTTATEVTVQTFEIHSLNDDRLSCRVSCSPGFYMRSLAHDLGSALGCGGCLEVIRRERSGPFGLNDAVTLDTIECEGEDAHQRLVPLGRLLPELPSVVVTDRGSRLATHGNVLSPAEMETSAEQDPHRSAREPGRRFKVYDRQGTLLAIAVKDSADALHPKIVLV